VQDGSAVLRVQGRVRRRRTPGRAGQELDQDQPEQRTAPAATTVVHHDNGGDDDSGRGHLGVCGCAPAASGQQTMSRRVRQRAVCAVLRRRGRRSVLSRRRQQLLRHRARRRTVGPAAAAAAAATASHPAVQTIVVQATAGHHHGRGPTVTQMPGILPAQPDGRVLRTAVRAGIVHVHV